MSHISTEEVVDILERTDSTVFLTGNAGTGKTYTIRRFQEQTTKTFAVCAPTGIAAINAGGTTIYKLLSYIPGMTRQQKESHYERPNMQKKRNYLCSLDCIILDEVSMMRADTLDEFSDMLQYARENDKPFGGIQMIFVGDLAQLPPVVTEKEQGAFTGGSKSIYASCFPIDARSWKESNPKIIRLTKIFRQEGDNSFIDILNEVRNGFLSPVSLTKLNTRVDSRELDSISVVSANTTVNKINAVEMDKLMGKTYVMRGITTGEFNQKMATVEEIFELKVGARVMIMANGTRGANGELGTLINIEEALNNVFATVKKDNGEVVSISKYTWTIEDKYYNSREKKFSTRILGSFTQIPLKPARAITVHKSQGLTFDKIHLDFTQGIFASGQLYVALSRCKSLEGITLQVPIKMERVQADSRVKSFMSNL